MGSSASRTVPWTGISAVGHRRLLPDHLEQSKFVSSEREIRYLTLATRGHRAGWVGRMCILEMIADDKIQKPLSKMCSRCVSPFLCRFDIPHFIDTTTSMFPA